MKKLLLFLLVGSNTILTLKGASGNSKDVLLPGQPAHIPLPSLNSNPTTTLQPLNQTLSEDTDKEVDEQKMIQEPAVQDVAVNAQDKCESTQLHDAAAKGNLAMVKELIARGVAINTPNGYGDTPLHKAAGAGHLTIVIELIKHGADSNAQNNEGSTPLHFAACKEDPRLMKLLARYGATFRHPTGKYKEDKNDYFYVAKELLKHGANANIRDNQGFTPCDWAKRLTNLNVVLAITKYSSRANACEQDREERSKMPSKEYLRSLIVSFARSLSPLQPSSSPWLNNIPSLTSQPLDQEFSKDSQEEVVQEPQTLTAFRIHLSDFTNETLRSRLQEGGVYVHAESLILDTRESDDATVNLITYDLIELIKEYFPNLKKITLTNGFISGTGTLLHWAAYGGHLDIVKELIANGADTNARTQRGETPLDFARKQKKHAVIRYLEPLTSKGKEKN